MYTCANCNKSFPDRTELQAHQAEELYPNQPVVWCVELFDGDFMRLSAGYDERDYRDERIPVKQARIDAEKAHEGWTNITHWTLTKYVGKHEAATWMHVTK